MKTKNNVQQTILKSMAVVFSVALISLTVNAQNFWQSIYENNGFKGIAMAMVDVNTATTVESTNADQFSYYTVENEETLGIENWMMDENNFGTFVTMETENESPLELEGWMTNDSYFNNASEMFIEATENDLEIEDWMLNENLFNASREVESALELESWMVSENIWKV